MALGGRMVDFRGIILDEPEAALSPQRQLSLLALLFDLVEDRRSQLLIASHSPILMAYPGATIYQLGSDGITQVGYEQTEHYQITRDFLSNPARFFKHLFSARDEKTVVRASGSACCTAARRHARARALARAPHSPIFMIGRGEQRVSRT